MSVSNNLAKELSEFGLNEIEIQLYLHLLNNQPQTMLDLSRQLAIPRTSVYDNAERLIEKGLAEKETTFKTQNIKALPVEMLKSILEQKKSEIKRLESSYKAIQKKVHTAASMVGTTQMRQYQGREGLKQMMWNSLQAKNKIVGYSEFGRVEIVGRTYEKQYADACKDRQLIDYVITNESMQVKQIINRTVKPSTHHITSLDTIRTLPTKKLTISGDTMIYNDIVALTYWDKKGVVGVEIENSEFAKTQISTFELLWEIAEPMTLESTSA